MIRNLIIAAALLLAGAANAEKITAAPELLEFKVRLVHHEDEVAVRNAYIDFIKRSGQKNVHRFATKQQGFAAWVGEVCELHYVPAKRTDDRYRMSILGHELEHCSRGAYHSDLGE